MASLECKEKSRQISAAIRCTNNTGLKRRRRRWPPQWCPQEHIGGDNGAASPNNTSCCWGEKNGLSVESLNHGSPLKTAVRVAVTIAWWTTAACDRAVFPAVSLKKKKKRLQVRAGSVTTVATFYYAFKFCCWISSRFLQDNVTRQPWAVIFEPPFGEKTPHITHKCHFV